jgi:hypothetical protein
VRGFAVMVGTERAGRTAMIPIDGICPCQANGGFPFRDLARDVVRPEGLRRVARGTRVVLERAGNCAARYWAAPLLTRSARVRSGRG